MFKTLTLILIKCLILSNCFEVKLKNVIMAHRGTWGYFPEHALDGFTTAYYMGTDYLETDISITKDGQLIVFHDAYLDDVTDIFEHDEFISRLRNDTVDGNLVRNKLFVADFTYDEIQTLFINQRFNSRPQSHNKKYKVILLEDLIKMTIDLNTRLNRTVGIYVEPKSPELYDRLLNYGLNQKIYDMLKKYGLHDKNSETFKLCPIVIESFDFESIKFFKSASNLATIYLMRWNWNYNLTEVAKYADGIGPDLDFIYYERIDDTLYCDGVVFNSLEEFKQKVTKKMRKDSIEVLGKKILSQKSNKFIDYAHKLGLVVHPWTMANDFPRISYDSTLEYNKLMKLGVDGFFTDFCDTGLFAVQHFNNLNFDFWIKNLKKNSK